MNIKIFCMACKEEILQADTETLRTPLVGNMFRVKHMMEWDIFSQYDTDKDLVCPLCSWCFHENGKVATMIGGELITGRPVIIVLAATAYALNSGKTTNSEPFEVKENTPSITTKPKRKVKRKVKKKKKKAKRKAKKGARKQVKSPQIQKIQSDAEANDQAYWDKKKKIDQLRQAGVDAGEAVKEQKEKPKEEKEEYVPPSLNRGPWNETENTSEDSEMNGKAPPGMVATEPKKGVTTQ